MSDDALVKLLQWVQTWGVWLSWLAWATVFLGALAMWRATRDVRGRGIWTAALVVTALAIIAHLADYVITLRRSPDLALELNPLWRNIVERYGIGVAKWYGLTGKLLVSVLAGQMTAFYLGNRQRLFPLPRAGETPSLRPAWRPALLSFITHMGERSRTWRDRAAALFTIFAFFFAGLTFFYFYIAYQNSITDSVMLDRLPSTPLAVLLYVAVLCVAFVGLTFRAFRKWSVAGGQCPEEARPATAAGAGK